MEKFSKILSTLISIIIGLILSFIMVALGLKFYKIIILLLPVLFIINMIRLILLNQEPRSEEIRLNGLAIILSFILLMCSVNTNII